MRKEKYTPLNPEDSSELFENSQDKSSATSEPGIQEILDKSTRLSGMYKNWFLDYASYVILERAVPHIDDGLKPVQRRILHSMKKLDDGRYNKVANIIGHTMQYHPHGDASIGDALVQIGQRELIIDAQGNWGNIFTGDRAAAPRYIEARLSKFANTVLFNHKTTIWKQSYDGRNKEPVTLPVKFPLLLFLGVEGIAVGLASKIMPHNFNEIIDASISHLQEKNFEIFPDFPTAGLIDVSKYNEGLRGGVVKIRARINKFDKKTLVINEIPFYTNTNDLIDSIIKATEKGKIKIRKIDDNTAENVEIILHLHPGTSPDKTIDALYAFTNCEYSYSPNSCVIQDNKPVFISIKEILKHNVDRTKELLKRELEIKLSELQAEWHFASLESIFIEKRIYRKIEESETWEAVIDAIGKGLKPYIKHLKQPVTPENIVSLTEIKIKRISRYDLNAAEKHIKSIEYEMEEVQNFLDNLTDYTIQWFKQLKKQFGKGLERKTEIRNFESIQAAQVVEANEKLYVHREDGFFGTGLKKDEFVTECSDIDDIIVILRDGRYIITKVSDKAFFGKNIMHIAVFRKNDERTIYNAVYRDGKYGPYLMKRFAITGITRDKEYNITQGKENSKILHLTINPNGEGEIVKVFLKPKPKLKKLVFEVDFANLAIKGRNSMGNIITRNEIHKVVLKEKGTSTLGGINVWFDDATKRLNNDGRGILLGEFNGDDKIIAFFSSGYYRLSNYDLENHYEDDLLLLQKYSPQLIYTAVSFDAEQDAWYLKRFNPEPSFKPSSFIGESEGSKLSILTYDYKPLLEVKFGGKHKNKETLLLSADEFIGVKSYKARGKRISPYEISSFKWLEPLEKDYPPLPESEDSQPGTSSPAESYVSDSKQMKLNL